MVFCINIENKVSKRHWTAITLFILNSLCTGNTSARASAALADPSLIKPEFEIAAYGSGKSQFKNPLCAAFNSDGKLFVCDEGNNRIQVFDRKGHYLKTIGHFGKQDGEFSLPCAVAATKDLLAVADVGNGRVQILNSDGDFLRQIPVTAPLGVDLDEQRVYVITADQLQVFSRDGKSIFKIDGTERSSSGRFNGLTGVTVDDLGYIYVADGFNNRIQKLDKEGKFVSEWGTWGSYDGLFATPSSVRYADGSIYVSDLTNHRIQVFDRSGKFKYKWGRAPVAGQNAKGRMHYPNSITISPDGAEAVVCEPIENRLQFFSKNSLLGVKPDNDQSDTDADFDQLRSGAQVVAAGNLLAVSDPDTNSVLVFDISAEKPKYIAELGEQGNKIAEMIEPSGVVIDSRKRTLINVSDEGNYRTEMFELYRPNAKSAFEKDVSMLVKGHYFSFAPAAMVAAVKQNELDGEGHIKPAALVKSPSGDELLADLLHSKIMVLDSANRVKRSIDEAGTKGYPFFGGPLNFSFSKDGTTTFAADSLKFRIAKFDARSSRYIGSIGKGRGAAPGYFILPYGITSGIDGFVYVTDSIKNTVQKFKEDGTFVEEFGRWGVGNGQFRAAKGIAQDRHGRLYVMDFGNHRGVILKNGADGKLKFVSNFELRDSAEQMRRTSYPLMGKVKRIESNTVVKAGASTADVFEGPSNDGTYKVKVFAAEKLRKNTPTELTVQITPSKGVELAVSGAMPLHGHGLTQLPIVKKTGDGKFLVSNFNLHMKGQWQVFFDIEDGDNFERAQMDVDLQ